MMYIFKKIIKSILFAILIVFVFLFILAKYRITDFGILVVLSIAIISTIIFCTYTIIETIEKNS
ncbi:hypothetical protein [Clostridium sp.]|uniref:hypothetical protein n=1 Tax=Clostridium sp. TaxID=1506 RepID=UPI002A81DCA5|nr:hypothetical protein [Clostridium sp.]MDY4251705.1 hypothetical protein [Clostridium sp.]